MTLQEIQNVITNAKSLDNTIFIEGYVNSNGETKDYICRILGRTGYYDLVRESLDIINNDSKKFLFDLRPNDADELEWAQAVNEQIASFEKSLNPEKSKAKPANFSQQLIRHGDVFVYADEVDAGTITEVVIKDLRVLASTVKSGAVPEKLPKGNIPRLKHIIRQALPVGSYVASFILRPGKFTSVKALVMG